MSNKENPYVGLDMAECIDLAAEKILAVLESAKIDLSEDTKDRLYDELYIVLRETNVSTCEDIVRDVFKDAAKALASYRRSFRRQ